MMNHLLASIDVEREGRNINHIIKNINAEIHLVAIDSDLFFTPMEDKKTFELGKKIGNELKSQGVSEIASNWREKLEEWNKQ